MILAAGCHVQDLAVSIQLEPIGCHLTLRNRRSKAPRCADEHSSVRGSTQPSARCAGIHERLYENGHCGIGWVYTVCGHVPQRAR
jgi:hypothetical protein